MSTMRRLARNVAKVNMKKAGMVQICKKGAKKGTTGSVSYFSIFWREWAKK